MITQFLKGHKWLFFLFMPGIKKVKINLENFVNLKMTDFDFWYKVLPIYIDLLTYSACLFVCSFYHNFQPLYSLVFLRWLSSLVTFWGCQTKPFIFRVLLFSFLYLSHSMPLWVNAEQSPSGKGVGGLEREKEIFWFFFTLQDPY